MGADSKKIDKLDRQFNYAGIAGVIGAGIIVICLVLFVVKPKCKENQKATDNSQLFDGYQDAPGGVKPVPGPTPEQTADQRKRAIKFADNVYVKEFGGPFGSGRERMVPMGQKIKSSPGYHFRPPPPAKSVSTSSFDEYPAVPTSNGITYRELQGQTCTAQHMSSSMSMILDTCDALCSHDNQCLAYSYDFTNGNCLTYPVCEQTKSASRNSKLFVKSKA